MDMQKTVFGDDQEDVVVGAVELTVADLVLREDLDWVMREGISAEDVLLSVPYSRIFELLNKAEAQTHEAGVD